MLTPRTGRRRQIETAQDSGWFPRSTWARDPAPSSAQPSSSCSSPGTLLGRGCQGWEGQGHTHLEGTEPLTNRPSGFLLQQLETHPRPEYGDAGHCAEKPQLRPGSGSSPSASYQVDGCQHSQGKDGTDAHIRLSSPTGHTRETNRDGPARGLNR